MSLCVITAGKAVSIAAAAFTLSWTHSVEKTRWEEDWRITTAGLEIVEARIKGSGAGMEPPDGAVLEEGWLVYAPDVPPQRRVVLAASGATGEGWSLCARDECIEIGAAAGEPVTLTLCDGRSMK
ncbi:MAG: DUF1850 domain-containing protein [Pseudaminobacter sp.]|nr:DUF1850 domain-containing protein [Pseudaminobacter sp.]